MRMNLFRFPADLEIRCVLGATYHQCMNRLPFPILYRHRLKLTRFKFTFGIRFAELLKGALRSQLDYTGVPLNHSKHTAGFLDLFTLRREDHLRTASPPIKTDVPPEPVNEWQDRIPLCNVLNKMVSLSVPVDLCQFYPRTD
ncbi:hypothetical protein CEXT_449321 [Caerostris extrusa]|uniref:Uncharacterized protein n=1 Tax=Caerostris extrusa TaxID=172846 RepID=A0AAV4UX76_CAEEX|nr:hypothetical protein CEXT_449321 [Caerostris extrusa]